MRSAAPTRMTGCAGHTSSLAVLLLRLVLGQAPDTRMRPAAIGDDDRQHDLVGPRRIGDADLHRVVVRAYERRVLEMQRHVDAGARPTELLRRGDDRLATSHRGAERRPE